ncbi:430_t:CDS:2 [Rhizophagus irregularis]|nr:430_t:CDS:2 [Rhizophagus irregularis]
MESEIDLLRQENARLVAKITGLESEKAELLKQVAEEKAKHEAENTELRSRIEELEKGRTDTTDAIAELKAEVVKLRDDNERSDGEMVSGNEQKTIDGDHKSSEEKETDAFLNKGLIQEINSSMKEKHAPHLSTVTEISANQVRPNSETSLERNEE